VSLYGLNAPLTWIEKPTPQLIAFVSGPGGRRFKSSLPDQYFQLLASTQIEHLATTQVLGEERAGTTPKLRFSPASASAKSSTFSRQSAIRIYELGDLC